MRLLIHDLEEEQFKSLLPEMSEEVTIISNNKSIRNCVGCFGCWIKAPGECVIKDDYKYMGKLIAECDELVLISKCYYGGFSPFVKNVLDRSIGYILPYFLIRNGEMHHKSRYKKQLKLSAIVYSDNLTKTERETMESLIVANSLNFNAQEQKVVFCNNTDEVAKQWRALQ